MRHNFGLNFAVAFWTTIIVLIAAMILFSMSLPHQGPVAASGDSTIIWLLSGLILAFILGVISGLGYALLLKKREDSLN